MKRYFVLFIVGALVFVVFWLVLSDYFVPFVSSFLVVVFGEVMALLLSELSLFAYTKIKFSDYFLRGEDAKYSDVERGNALNLAGKIFVGVHILVAVIIAGVYFTYFN